MKLLGKAISGTCGARTYSVGGAGVTARQKVCPVNKNSLAQTRRRGLFAAAGAAFKSMTAEQRAELHARALAASETDVFGKKITLSDYAFFIREWMRGIRPAPSNDPSIQLLHMLRGTSWNNMNVSGDAAFINKQNGAMSAEMKALIQQCPTNFFIEYEAGKFLQSTLAKAATGTMLQTKYKWSFTSMPIQLTFRDVLGREFNFLT